MTRANDSAAFEDLEVFRRAYRLSLELHRASLEFPRIEQWALADQVRRSSKSICANLAEGFAKQGYSAAEYRRYLLTAIGQSTRRSCGCATVSISAMSRSHGQEMARATLRSAGCCAVFTLVGSVVLIPGSWLLSLKW